MKVYIQGHSPKVEQFLGEDAGHEIVALALSAGGPVNSSPGHFEDQVRQFGFLVFQHSAAQEATTGLLFAIGDEDLDGWGFDLALSGQD